MQLKIVLWNANGLAQHTEEVKHNIQTQQVDIMLISETHFTTKSYFKIPNYTIYDTQHPDGTAHGGTAIIIISGIKHHLHGRHTQHHLLATSVTIEDWVGPPTIAAIYCAPKHSIKAEQFQHLYATPGHRFLAGAKHTHWGSRHVTPRGRELHKAMQKKNLQHASAGEPTYWPSDRRKIPDFLDFGVMKRIPTYSIQTKAGFDLSSDHSPVIITMHTRPVTQPRPTTLSTKMTDLEAFRSHINGSLTLKVPLKTDRDIEEYVHHIAHTIQQAAWSSTPNHHTHHSRNACTPALKQKILDKRRLRKR
jgi:hypothetical protein